MNLSYKIRQKFTEFGFRPKMNEEVQALEAQFTICQLIVVVLSIMSVAFLFIPLMFLQDVRFVIAFFGVSFILLTVGMWFWFKRHEICEHPEEYNK